MSAPAYIFDLDGVLRDCSHRERFLHETPKNWAAFFEAQVDDPPIPALCYTAEFLARVHDVVICTGGGEEHRPLVEKWLGDNLSFVSRSTPAKLYMRAAGDRRDDSTVKVELVERIVADGFEPLLIFEDRKRVVDALRQKGWLVAQVAPGDF